MRTRLSTKCPSRHAKQKVFIHIGTNNASQQRARQSVASIVEEYERLVARVTLMYPNCEIWCSGILPRLDSDHW